MTETIGQRIRRLRKRRGWTQSRLGDEVGRGKSSISQWETGVYKPSYFDDLTRLAFAFGMTVEELTEDAITLPLRKQIADLQERVVALEHAIEVMGRVLIKPAVPRAPIIPYRLGASVPRDPVADLRRPVSAIR